MNTAAESSTEIEVLVSEAADRFTEEVKRGQTPSIDQYAQQYPQIAEIIRQVFPALAVLDVSSAVEPEGIEDGRVSGQLGDYRILGEIGRGGMGVVYEAEQISIGRRVALKVLPFAALLNQQQLNRFKNEARAAGTLDHPNIVSVYSVGTERGVHYYAMRLVEGQSLAEIIAERRRSRNSPTTRPAGVDQPDVELPSSENDATATNAAPAESAKRSPESPTVATVDTQREPRATLTTIPAANTEEYFRSLARLGMQAAQALDHAHQNGIVHRDVKPANLLVNSEGKLWVTDFGLARIESDASFTMTGDILGTLRYMSPEQAQAARAVVDHRTDIYSLGATLYELLTLQPAFGGTDRRELLQQIAEEEPISPGKINPAIPRDLETIVGKAMEKRPEDRYRTAQEMADDLTCFLQDRPIQAKPPAVAARVVKWTRRHKGLVTSSAILLILGSIGLAIGNVMLASERDQKNAALQASEANLDRALDAVDKLLANITDKRILNAPHMGPVQREMAEEALSLCEVLLEQNPKDPRVSHRHAAIRLQKGKILRKLGEYEEAEESLRKATLQLQALVRETADAATREGYEILLSESHLSLGQVLKDVGEYQESIAVLRDALNLGKRLVAAHPQIRKYSEAVAHCYHVLGAAQQALRHDEDALAAYREAIRIRRQLMRDHPDDTKYCVALAGILVNQGNLGHESDASYKEAIRLTQLVLDREATNVEARVTLAGAHMNMANWHKARGHLAEAQRGCQDAIAVYEKLSQEHPLVPWYRVSLAGTYGNQGETYAAAGQEDEALGRYARAVSILESVLSRHEADAKALEFYVKVLLSYDLALTRLNRYDDSAEVWSNAIDVLQPLAEASPVDYRQELAEAHHKKAHAMAGSGSARLGEREAKAVLEQWHVALDAQRQLAEDNPDHPDHNITLADVMLCLGRFHDVQGNETEKQTVCQDALTLLRKMPKSTRQRANWRRVKARAHFRLGDQENLKEAIRLYESFTEEDPDDGWHQLQRAFCFQKLADLLRDEERYDEAEPLLRKAIQIVEQHVANHPDKSWYTLDKLAGCHESLGHTFKKAGRVAECIDAYRQAIALQTDVMRRRPGAWEFFQLLWSYKQVYELPCADEHLDERLQWQRDWLAAYEEFEGDFPNGLNPDDPRVSKPAWQNIIAWNLINPPDARLRNVDRAIELAQEAAHHAPEDGNILNTLGVAQYRAGNWEESIKTLEKSMKLRFGGDSSDWLFLAMAHWQLGQVNEARQWYDRAVEWMTKNKPENAVLRRFRAEAAEILKDEEE